MITVNFSEKEATALVQMLDLAVKSGGLQVAATGHVLAQKLEEAAKAAAEKNGGLKVVDGGIVASNDAAA